MGFGKDGKGAIIRQFLDPVSLGAIATGIAITFGNVVIEDDFRLLKSEVMCGITGGDAGEAEGVMLGLCNGELSTTEIAECLRAMGPVDRNDRLREERAMRQCHSLGVGVKTGVASTEVVFRDKITNAPMCIDKFPWTYSNPEGWDFFLYNQGPAIATGSNVYLQATHYGVWVT